MAPPKLFEVFKLKVLSILSAISNELGLLEFLVGRLLNGEILEFAENIERPFVFAGGRWVWWLVVITPVIPEMAEKGLDARFDLGAAANFQEHIETERECKSLKLHKLNLIPSVRG